MAEWSGNDRRRKPEPTERLIIELPLNSNLDKVVRLFISTLGQGLNAIALALSTPQDNSAAVQAEIDKVTATLNASTAELKGEIDQHTKEN